MCAHLTKTCCTPHSCPSAEPLAALETAPLRYIMQKPMIFFRHDTAMAVMGAGTLLSNRLAMASALSSAGKFHSLFSMVMGRGVSGGTIMRRAYRLLRVSGMPARSQSIASAWLLLCECGRPCATHPSWNSAPSRSPKHRLVTCSYESPKPTAHSHQPTTMGRSNKGSSLRLGLPHC